MVSINKFFGIVSNINKLLDFVWFRVLILFFGKVVLFIGMIGICIEFLDYECCIISLVNKCWV